MKKPSKSIEQIRAESVRGEHEGWPLDSRYPKNPSHESGFKDDGDNQRVLWQIYDCAERGEPIPPWAASAFRDLLDRVMSCELTWSEAFGEVPAKISERGPYKNTIQRLAKNLIKVGEAERDYRGPGAEEKRTSLSKKLGLPRKLIIEYLGRYKRSHRS